MKKISVGVSGGVDSAATVLMLKELGYEVYGVRFAVNQTDYRNNLLDNSNLSERLDIEINEVDITQTFEKKIITPFIDSYLSGRTPSPCVECNCSIKWDVIEQNGAKIGAQNWATGHYARVVEHNGLYYVAKGVDPVKDQSYYLWQLSQSTLKGAIMVLGDKRKEQIKEFMFKKGYRELSSKKESMGVCFLGRGGYKELLKSRVDNIERLEGGEIVDRDGRVVGRHDGYPFYTLAQRKGLGLVRPNCVVAVDSERNRLIVGDENELYCSTFRVKNYKFVCLDEVMDSKRLEVKVRGVGWNPEGYCKVDIVDGNSLIVNLLSSRAWAVSSGQPVVFYIDDRVVGGGYII
ncbi:MAG: tRNA 2-thiouridine(34) synthase MnmA [Rikenellaceae bacterium]